MSNPELPDAWTTISVGTISVIGALSKTAQWRDPKTGNFSIAAMVSGIATCLILASIVMWIGQEHGLSIQTQVVVSGVGCYVGPDPIIRGLASAALKMIGVNQDGSNGNSGNGPKAG